MPLPRASASKLADKKLQNSIAGPVPLSGMYQRTLRLLLTDIVSFTLAMLLGLLLGFVARLIILGLVEYPKVEDLPRIIVMFVPALLILIGRSLNLGHYSRYRPFWLELNETVTTILIIATFDAFILFVMGVLFSRLWFGFFLLLLIVFIPFGRYRSKLLLIKQNKWFQPTYVVGVRSNAIKTALAIESDMSMGYSVKGFIDLENKSPEYLNEKPVFSSVEDASQHALNFNSACTPTLVFALETQAELNAHQEILNNYIAKSAWVSVVPPPLEMPLYDASVIGIYRHDTALLRLQNNLNNRFSRIAKRCTDLLIGSIFLMLLSPLFLLLAILIARKGKNIFYKHKRVGFGGREFECIKFHTMVENGDALLAKHIATNPLAAEEWKQKRKLKHDPRVTRIGHYLRRTSLDELPQLWNVLKGEMSLVGPRPIVNEELTHYGEFISYYHSMKPGMTGLWQVSGRTDTSYPERVRLDVWYCRNWSTWIDLVVLIQTIKTLIDRHGAY